jgi:hypothetical protein
MTLRGGGDQRQGAGRDGEWEVALSVRSPNIVNLRLTAWRSSTYG